MNNGCYHKKSYKEKHAKAIDKRFGPVVDHLLACSKCGKEFTWNGRKNTKAYKQPKFCSRSCANYRGEGLTYAKELVGYRTICKAHHGNKCIICGFDKIIETHHVDENRENNSPENLVPLCPNHHEMRHTKRYMDEIEKHIQKYVKKYKMDSR